MLKQASPGARSPCSAYSALEIQKSIMTAAFKDFGPNAWARAAWSASARLGDDAVRRAG